MIKKESIKKLLVETAIKRAEPFLLTKGFKYVKSQQLFYKTEKEYKQIISISHSNAEIGFDEKRDCVNLVFTVTSMIELPKFEKWCLNAYGQKSRLYHRLNSFTYHLELTESDLSILETYVPTKSQQFKAYVRGALGGSLKTGTIPFTEIEQNGFDIFITNLSLFSNPILIYKNRKIQYDLVYIRMLEFLGETAKAKEENVLCLNDWKELIKQTEFKSNAERKQTLDDYNQRVSVVNKRFSTNIELWIEEFKLFDFKKSSEQYSITNNIMLKKIFSISEPSSNIIRYEFKDDHYFQIRGDASVIVHNEAGKIIQHFSLGNQMTKGTTRFNNTEQFSYVFENNFLITTTSIFELKFSTNITFDDLRIPAAYSQVYLPARKEFAFLISNHKAHELHLFDNKLNHIKAINFEKMPSEIVPELEIVICEVRSKSCDIYDLEGNFMYSMLSTNAWYSYKQHYDYNLEADLFLSAWYYTKSQLFKLSTGELVKNLWAHPTYMKGYKEKLYSDINHNFGMSRFRFSPKGDYIIGGADHGKYVAWNTNSLKRVELIPNDEYLKRMPNASIWEIEGIKMLKNRRNQMGQILFINQGDFFAFQINKDMLIWNRNFEHINTIVDIGYIKKIDEQSILIENDGIHSICKFETR